MLKVEKINDVVKCEFTTDISYMIVDFAQKTILLKPLKLIEIDVCSGGGSVIIIDENDKVLFSDSVIGNRTYCIGELTAKLTDWLGRYELGEFD